MRDSDWSREKMLRSDWLLPSVATITTWDLELTAESLLVGNSKDLKKDPRHQR